MRGQEVSDKANAAALRAEAQKLKENQYYIGEIPGQDLTYVQFLNMAGAVALEEGVLVQTITGCGQCPEHINNPIPHTIALARVENPLDPRAEKVLRAVLFEAQNQVHQ